MNIEYRTPSPEYYVVERHCKNGIMPLQSIKRPILLKLKSLIHDFLRLKDYEDRNPIKIFIINELL
jgi:hypothetical protein